MKKINHLSLQLTLCVLSFSFFHANAQNLPNVQKNSFLAPANIKIDGKANEWSNQFQAHNHATSVFYTVANDDKNLYLLLQTTDVHAISSILHWGIKFSVNLSGNKTDKGAFSVTYPYYEKMNGFSVNLKDYSKIIAGSDSSVTRADSFMNATNKRMTAKMKFLKISTTKVTDTVISVYNEDGIRAASLFNNKMSYTYELSISLKELGITVNNPDKFAYHVVINGNPNFYPGTYAKIDKVTGQTTYLESPPELTGTLPTDFWGEYILAKKYNNLNTLDNRHHPA